MCYFPWNFVNIGAEEIALMGVLASAIKLDVFSALFHSLVFLYSGNLVILLLSTSMVQEPAPAAG